MKAKFENPMIVVKHFHSESVITLSGNGRNEAVQSVSDKLKQKQAELGITAADTFIF